MAFRDDIPVTYHDGAFHPDQPVALPGGAKATVRIAPQPPTQESRRAAWEFIERIRREKLVRLGGYKFNRDELYDRR